MPITYPASITSMPNPGPTTKRDAPGFELDVLVSDLGDLAEQLQLKLGTGASTPGAAAGVLRRTGVGSSAWGAIQGADLAAGAISQFSSATPTTATPTTTSTSPVAMPQMTATMTAAGGGLLLVLFEAILDNTVAGAVMVVDLVVSTGGGFRREVIEPVANNSLHIAGFAVTTTAAGVVTASLNWFATTGTLRNPGTERALSILEIRR